MASDYVPLCRCSQGEAVRQRKLDLWCKSFGENVSCARDIEMAIRCENDEHIHPGCAKAVLEKYGFARTMYVLANSVRNLGPMLHPSEDAATWAKSIEVPPDPEYNRYFEVDTALVNLEEFIGQTRDAYEALGLFDQSQYAPIDGMALKGKVLVMSPYMLREEYWTPKAQLWLAQKGLGCDPDSSISILWTFCLGASEPEPMLLHRQDFIGVLDEKFLPDWARNRLEELTAPAQDQTARKMDGMEMR